MFELVKELSELPGPTGHEDAVQDWLVERWGTFSQEVRRTRVDNVLAYVGGKGPRLALVAHADELSLLVKSISEDGFLHLWPYSDGLGRPPRWFMPLGQPALVVTSRRELRRHHCYGDRARRGWTRSPAGVGLERLVC